jgi:hypothetical protein
VEPDEPTVLLQTDLTVENLIARDVSKLEVAETAFRALEVPVAAANHLRPHIRSEEV